MKKRSDLDNLLVKSTANKEEDKASFYERHSKIDYPGVEYSEMHKKLFGERSSKPTKKFSYELGLAAAAVYGVGTYGAIAHLDTNLTGLIFGMGTIYALWSYAMYHYSKI